MDSPSDIRNLHLAAKYLDKTFNMFDEKALGRPPSSGVRDWIYDEIQSRFGSRGGDSGLGAETEGPT
jgi:hypothetical protein